MSLEIQAYELQLLKTQTIETHTLLRPLTVQAKGDKLLLYAVVDSKSPRYSQTIRIVQTGQEMPDILQCRYLSTLIPVVEKNGVRVESHDQALHVFHKVDT